MAALLTNPPIVIKTFFHMFEKSSFLFLVVSGSINWRFKEGQNFELVKNIAQTRDTKVQVHWKVTLGVFYRLTNLYLKIFSHVR